MKIPLVTMDKPRTEGKLLPVAYSVNTSGNVDNDIPRKKTIMINIVNIGAIVVCKAKPIWKTTLK